MYLLIIESILVLLFLSTPKDNEKYLDYKEKPGKFLLQEKKVIKCLCYSTT